MFCSMQQISKLLIEKLAMFLMAYGNTPNSIRRTTSLLVFVHYHVLSSINKVFNYG